VKGPTAIRIRGAPSKPKREQGRGRRKARERERERERELADGEPTGSALLASENKIEREKERASV